MKETSTKKLRGRVYLPACAKPGDRVRVITKKCGCIRFRVNGRPIRQVLRCAAHEGGH